MYPPSLWKMNVDNIFPRNFPKKQIFPKNQCCYETQESHLWWTKMAETQRLTLDNDSLKPEVLFNKASFSPHLEAFETVAGHGKAAEGWKPNSARCLEKFIAFSQISFNNCKETQSEKPLPGSHYVSPQLLRNEQCFSFRTKAPLKGTGRHTSPRKIKQGGNLRGWRCFYSLSILHLSSYIASQFQTKNLDSAYCHLLNPPETWVALVPDLFHRVAGHLLEVLLAASGEARLTWGFLFLFLISHYGSTCQDMLNHKCP